MDLGQKNPQRDSLQLSTFYVINLASRSDRRQHALDQISRFGLNSIFIDAVSVDKLTTDEFGFLTPPAFACWKSHMKAFESFLASGDSMAVILEDDFQIDNFQALQRTLRKLNFENFDVVQIGYLINNYRERLEIFFKNMEFLVFLSLRKIIHLYPTLNSKYARRLRIQRVVDVPIGFVPDDLRAGAHAYIVSRSAAQRILSSFGEQNILTMDGFLISTNWTRPFRTIRVSRSHISQMNSPSSIR